LLFSVSLFAMNHNLDCFLTNLGIVQILDCLLGSILSFKLNISKSSAFTIGINFEFAWFDITKLSEHIIQFFLVSLLWQISNQNISLTIKSTGFVLFSVKNNASIINCSIIHFFQTSVSLLLGIEVEVTKAFWSLGLWVEHDFDTCEFVSLCVKEFQQVKVESLVRKVSYVQSEDVWVVSFLGWLLRELDSHAWYTSHAEPWHTTWHLTHHTHAAWSSHWVLDNWSVLSHVLLVLIHHLLVSSWRESTLHLVSHVSLVHELHLWLIHSSAHSWIKVATTWELVIAVLRRSSHHHLRLAWHLPTCTAWSGWHCCLRWTCHLRRLAALSWWLG
jgi:hypothetical protein